MIGKVFKGQETLKLIDKAPMRLGTVNYGKAISGRTLMKEGRTKK